MYFSKISDISFNKIAEQDGQAAYKLVFIAEKSAHYAKKLIASFNSHQIKIFGGIYPTIFFNKQKYDEGFLILSLPMAEHVLTLSALDDSTFNIDFTLENINTAILLTDGLMEQTDTFLRKVYSKFGNEMNIVGGGAGFMSLTQQPCLFTNDGIFKDCGILALLKNKSKIGVKHGWEVFDGPFIATSTQKNVIIELNWRPAFEVYKEAIENNSTYIFKTDNFFEIAKRFPFGIYKEGTEYIVRDPFVLNDDNSITCISEIPENSTLQILTGNPDTLIQAAMEVAKMTNSVFNENSNFLIFDCISRVMFLNDRFKDELEVIGKVYCTDKIEIFGVATLGEIASDGMGFVEFYNKTIVACNLEI
jgi:hypothetical protein